jgi:hypothetical protein
MLLKTSVILALLEGVACKGSLQGKFLPVRLNGETGLLLMKEWCVSMAVCFCMGTG